MMRIKGDFKAIVVGFHNEFFGEHPDNSLYVSLSEIRKTHSLRCDVSITC